MPFDNPNSMSEWDILTTLADMASASCAMLTGRHVRIEYWLKQAEDEAYRAMQGKSTKTSALPAIIEGCPDPENAEDSRLSFVENKLAELRSVASAQGLGNLAMSIEAARMEAKKKASKRRFSGHEHPHHG